jgi:hypothetical protein
MCSPAAVALGLIAGLKRHWNRGSPARGIAAATVAPSPRLRRRQVAGSSVDGRSVCGRACFDPHNDGIRKFSLFFGNFRYILSIESPLRGWRRAPTRSSGSVSDDAAVVFRYLGVRLDRWEGRPFRGKCILLFRGKIQLIQSFT